MIFRQLFDPETSTYSYLVADPETREAALVDSVDAQLERDTTLLTELGLQLRYALETHVHADHITASGLLREKLGARVAVGAQAGVENADLALADGDRLSLGSLDIEVLATPGHTSGCVTYYVPRAGMAFTGDALLIRGCGRTDFQQGDPAGLFRSVRERIFALPDDTLLYPGHDYKGRTVTTVAEEKRFNPRLRLATSEQKFIEIMDALNLALPKRIDEAVPANLLSGLGGRDARARAASERAAGRGRVAEVMQELGRQDAELSFGMGI